MWDDSESASENTLKLISLNCQEPFRKILKIDCSRVIYLSLFNYGGLILAVFRQFCHIYTRHYFYPLKYNPS